MRCAKSFLANNKSENSLEFLANVIFCFFVGKIERILGFGWSHGSLLLNRYYSASSSFWSIIGSEGKFFPPFLSREILTFLLKKTNFYLPFIRRNQAEQNGTKKVNCTKDFWNNMRTFWRSCEKLGKLGKENHYCRLLWIFIIGYSNQ